MKRNVKLLSQGEFDVLIIGAGIHGACIARDASLRGLRVALIDKGDLGGETSHNSLKTLHGGVRYLQHLNIRRTLESIREQLYYRHRCMDYVKELPFVMPTYGWGMRGPIAMWAGLVFYNLLVAITCLRLGYPFYSKWARVMSRREYERTFNVEADIGVTGAALWHEVQVEHADRALLDIIADASSHGCQVASYVRSEKLVINGDSVGGACVRDVMTDSKYTVFATVVVDATGPWVGVGGNFSSKLSISPISVPCSKSMNLVVNKAIKQTALGATSRYTSDSTLGNTRRLYFIVPWLGVSIVGTSHSSAVVNPDSINYNEEDVEGFLAEINDAFPELSLKKNDVLYCYQGLTPLDEPQENNVSAMHHSLVVDHRKSGVSGMISVVGVKWTTARIVAQRVVNEVCDMLETAIESNIEQLKLTGDSQIATNICHLSDSEIVVFCRYHIENTMTLRLRDLLLRRSNDLITGRLSKHQIILVEESMAEKLGWDSHRRAEERELLIGSAFPHWRHLDFPWGKQTNH